MSRISRSLMTATAIAVTLTSAAMAQPVHIQAPPMPRELRVPEGHTPYLKAFAMGTQNYICLPGANGPEWRFLGPQATLFLPFPGPYGENRQQVATHYLSANPGEGGTFRPTWQHSSDTSTVWGRAIASSLDPQYVAPGAIAWLLVQISGARTGPTGGAALAETTYIHRLNTAGGVAPAGGCVESTYGTLALSPYTTDYYFYKAERRRP